MSHRMQLFNKPNPYLGAAMEMYGSPVSSIHKFGAVPAMSQNQSGTIWDINDTPYPWSAFSSASTVTVDRASTDDADKVVTIEGLDANYLHISEDVTLSSATGNASTQSFIRVFRAFMHNGSAANVGNISIKVSTTVVAQITAGKSQTLMAVYTVPAQNNAYLIKLDTTCQANADATVDVFCRYFGDNAFRVVHSFEVGGDGGQYMYQFGIPLVVPEKSDIDFRASVRSNNARVTSSFNILLVRDQ